MIGIKRYITEATALQDIDNLEDAQVISLDDTEAIYRVDKTNNRIEPITSPTLGIVPTGTIITYIDNTVPDGYLPCTGVEYDITQYPKLYTILQSNKTPDLRELVLVGVGRNETQDIALHDEFTLGQFKDSQMGEHWHGISNSSSATYNNRGVWFASAQSTSHATTTTTPTRTKQFGINYLIRAI